MSDRVRQRKTTDGQTIFEPLPTRPRTRRGGVGNIAKRDRLAVVSCERRHLLGYVGLIAGAEQPVLIRVGQEHPAFVYQTDGWGPFAAPRRRIVLTCADCRESFEIEHAGPLARVDGRLTQLPTRRVITG